MLLPDSLISLLITRFTHKITCEQASLIMSSKNVVFDVVGTLVSYDHLFQAIDDRLGDRLREHGIKPSLLGYT